MYPHSLWCSPRRREGPRTVESERMRDASSPRGATSVAAEAYDGVSSS